MYDTALTSVAALTTAPVGATAPIVNSLLIVNTVETAARRRYVPDRSTEHPEKVAYDAPDPSEIVVLEVHPNDAPAGPDSMVRTKLSPDRTLPKRSLATTIGWVPNTDPAPAPPPAGSCENKT